ncbi:MAG: 5-formyltetrahydrofolate cyclo-ligase [Lachnospiraceae bacterium]|nr:5-formyltetrahydrofolate cyclo-ligase [Lachnospiraceae bacterium]
MVKERRRELSEAVLKEKSEKICMVVLAMPEFRAADEVFVYMDCKGEVSTKPLIEAAWRLGKKVAAPKVEGENMSYYYISSYDDVEDGYFHVPEPMQERPVMGAAAERSLLIVPGVGFDLLRNRCGYGKGFYDRYLAAHPGHVTVALAFDFQIVDEVPTRPEDIRPMVLVTESRVLSGRENNGNVEEKTNDK